jgi:hypothetical protein
MVRIENLRYSRVEIINDIWKVCDSTLAWLLGYPASCWCNGRSPCTMAHTTNNHIDPEANIPCRKAHDQRLCSRLQLGYLMRGLYHVGIYDLSWEHRSVTSICELLSSITLETLPGHEDCDLRLGLSENIYSAIRLGVSDALWEQLDHFQEFTCPETAFDKYSSCHAYLGFSHEDFGRKKGTRKLP